MMMLTPLIALVALQGGLNDVSLLAKVVGVPTGKNGYEDYLRAADVAGSDLWGMYEQMMGYRISKLRAMTDPDVDLTLPPVAPGTTLDSTDLGIRIAANDRLGGTFDIVTQGNNKRVYDPRDGYTFETTFPEMARFKMLAKIGVNKAYVEFAEGKSTLAVRDLIEGLRFSRNIFDSVMIGGLVSIAMQSIFLAEFNRHLGQLSLSDAQLIDRTCQGLIDSPYPVREMLAREYRMTKSSLDQVLDKPDEFLTEEQNKAVGAALKGLSGPDRAQLKSFVTQALEPRYKSISDKLSGPESGWPVSDMSADPLVSLEDKSVSNLAMLLITELQGKSMEHQYTKAMAKARIQLRLLQLHAKVIEYRWQNSFLPAKIEDFAGPKIARDPFTGDVFHYELKDGNYRLYSTGVPGIGPIELKYRMQPSGGGGEGTDRPL